MGKYFQSKKRKANPKGHKQQGFGEELGE